MTTQAFIDPATGQVMALYRNCTYGGQEWQKQGFIEVLSDEKLTRDMRVTFEEKDGKRQVTSRVGFENPVKPIPQVPEKSALELKIEELEARLKVVEEKPLDEIAIENLRLRAEVAKMDGDGDGEIGGSKPRA